MSCLVRVSEAASLAVHTAAFLGRRETALTTTREIAQALRASEAHLAKVLQRLVRAGLVTSERGPRGGFKLARPADTMTLLEVYEAIEGTLAPSDCLLESFSCRGKCIMGDLIRSVNSLVSARLAETTVAASASSLATGGVNAEEDRSN